MEKDIKIGDRIKTRRLMLGLTQEDLADKLGYDAESKKSTISKIERNTNDLSRTKITLFAQALETTEAYLMGWTDDPDATREELLGRTDDPSPQIIAASTITTDGEPIVLHAYSNPKKDQLLKDIMENDIPDNILDLMRAAIAPYKK